MYGNYFYHESIRRAVAVFGTLFNDINVIRKNSDGSIKSTQKVPLSYGPKQKYLTRIDQQSDLTAASTAITLPRMSFELTGLNYDATSKMQIKTDLRYINSPGDIKTHVPGPIPYTIDFSLSIMAKNQDDALQILEQIIPHFQPYYTVTIKEVYDKALTDMPFMLTGIDLSDEYEGDHLTPRTIVYSLTFSANLRFYGPAKKQGLIKHAVTNIIDNLEDDRSKHLMDFHILVNPFPANKDDVHELEIYHRYATNVPEKIILEINTTNGFSVGDPIISNNTATLGFIQAINAPYITVGYPDGIYEIGEVISIRHNSAVSAMILSQQLDEDYG